MLGDYPLLISAQGDGAALASSTSATSLLPGQAKLTMPANWLCVPGQTLHVRAAGRISTLVTSPGTLTFTFRAGPTANIAVATSQALALNIVAKTNVAWYLDLLLTLRAVGASTTANFMAQGLWTSEANIGAPLPSAGGESSALWQASAPAVGTGFDSTVANQLDLTAQWSVNSASNSILCHQYQVANLGPN
jgi:hypothetical protein